MWYSSVDIAKYDDARGDVSTIHFKASGLSEEHDYFETMVFGGPLDHQQERCDTIEEAIQQHDRWVRLVQVLPAGDES